MNQNLNYFDQEQMMNPNMEQNQIIDNTEEKEEEAEAEDIYPYINDDKKEIVIVMSNFKKKE